MKTLDRLLLEWLMPTKWSFEDLILVEDIKKKVVFSQKEVEETNLRTTEKGLTRDIAKDKDKKIIFTETESNFITKLLKELSEKKELTKDHLGLYKTFIK